MIPLVVAAVIAVVHHFMLRLIHGRYVASVPLPEYWVRSFSNALALGVSTLLATSILTALIQLVRYLTLCSAIFSDMMDLSSYGYSSGGIISDFRVWTLSLRRIRP